MMTVVNVVLHVTYGHSIRGGVNGVVLNFTVLVANVRAVDNTISPLGSDPAFAGVLAVFSGPLVNVLMNVTFATILRDTSTAINMLRTLSMANVLAFSDTFPVILNVNMNTTYPILVSTVNTGGGNGHATLICLVGSLFNLVL